MIIFSDPHLGLKRKSHTTLKSREALEDIIFETAFEISGLSIRDNKHVICVGDLFDSFSNSENVIQRGAEIVDRCEAVVAGNHDMVSRCDIIGSLELIKLTSPKVVSADVEGLEAKLVLIGNKEVIIVPHHSCQSLFEAALEKAITLGDQQTSPIPLFLHCNYDNDMATDSDTALNITSEDADVLLETFSHIFIGHEHNPRTEKGGRVVIVGNPFPTSFSDISDKYYWELSDSGGVIKHPTFKEKQGYRDFKFVGQEAEQCGAEFIDVSGTIQPEDTVKLAKYIKELWAKNPQALMIRNNTEVRHRRIDVGRKVDMNNLKTIIKDAIREKDMKKLWEDYLEKVDD